jgi:ABC-type multidrug transport system fused ATPase/permease subunit
MKIQDTINFLFSCLKLRIKFFYFCLFLSVLSSLVEFLSISAVIPIISLLLSFESSVIINFISSYIQINKFIENNLIIIFLLIFLILVIFSSIIKIIISNYNTRLSAMIANDISVLIYEKTIKQSYENLISFPPNYLHTLCNINVDTIARLFVIFFNLISSIIVSLGIIIFLIFYDYKAAVICFIFMSLIYFFFGKFLKVKIEKNGEIISITNHERAKKIQETLPVIRDIILNSSHNIFIKYFANSDLNYRISDAKLIYLNTIQRPVLEGIGITIIVLLSYTLAIQSGEIKSSSIILITTIGVYTFAAQKLLPTFQIIYSMWASISGSYNMVTEIKEIIKFNNKDYFSKINLNLSFKSQIEFKNISFNYKNSKKLIFNNLNCKIMFGKKIFLAGRSGVGKTTFVDIFLGLLKPTSGHILIDGVKLDNSNLNSWFNKIAYVPQDLFLINDSIANNINYPNINKPIDLKKTYDALDKVQLRDFIFELPNKVETIFGKGGINLSGGQKQRLIIARALYKNKNILILDEATNALDSETEDSILDSILNNNKDLTVIVISHKKSLQRKFDEIIDLDI